MTHDDMSRMAIAASTGKLIYITRYASTAKALKRRGLKGFACSLAEFRRKFINNPAGKKLANKVIYTENAIYDITNDSRGDRAAFLDFISTNKLEGNFL